jgi:hypothetical protein
MGAGRRSWRRAGGNSARGIAGPRANIEPEKTTPPPEARLNGRREAELYMQA